MLLRATTVISLCGVLFTTGCNHSAPAAPAIQFSEVTASALGEVRQYPDVKEIVGVGAGLALADIDGDGALDLFVANSDDQTQTQHTPSALFRNDGTGRFIDVTSAHGLDLTGLIAHAAAFADLDNDGDPDLVVAGRNLLRIYRNDGAQFTDVSATAFMPPANGTRTVSISVADYDSDGLLDLYLSHYLPVELFAGPDPALMKNVLLHNQGGLSFADVSAAAGVDSAGLTWSATWFDADGDHRPDLYVANDTGRTVEFCPQGNPQALGDSFYLNNGNGTFRDAASQLGLDQRRSSMGGAVGDPSNSASGLDLYVSDFGGNSYFRNRGTTPWLEAAAASGITAGHDPSGIYELVSFGTLFWDFDRDGHEDLLIANGTVAHGNGPPGFDQAQFVAAQRDLVFHNRGDGSFEEVADAAGVDRGATAHQGRGVAHGDLDGDGQEDVLVAGYKDDVRVYLNRSAAPGHHFVRVLLEGNGTTSNRDAIGAQVTLQAGASRQVRQLVTSGSVGCNSARVLEFGIGAASSAALTIEWPDGAMQSVANVAIDQLSRIRQP
jgi:hypothetical protein